MTSHGWMKARFGLRYLFEEYPERHSELEKRVYVHNTFFYEKLKPAKSKDINYDGVKGWTSKVDLLSYDYIIIPVNEYYHWWVAIICNPGRLDPNHPRRSKDPTSSGRETSNSNSTEGKSDVGIEKSDDVEMIDVDNVQSRDQGQEIRTKEARESADPVETDSNKANRAGKTVVDLVADNTDNDLREKLNGITKPPKKDPSEETKILTLDSMGNSHYPAVAALKRYLLAEFEDKRQTKIKDPPKQIGMKAGNIPEQDNFSDCGIYLLGYIQQFVKDPDRFAQCLMQREKPGWEFDPSELREYWRNTIFEKQKEYQAKHDEEKRRKKEEAARRKAASSTPSDTVKPADNVVVDLERDESEPEDEVPHLLPDSPLPSEIRRPRSKDHEHSPIQRVSSRTSRQSPEVKFIPKLPDSSPASDRRTSGIAQEISPQTFYSNVPLKPQSPRPQSPLVERKRKPSPARKAKASSPARKTAPSPEPKAQPPESIEIFDPPTPEVQTPATTASKAKTEKRDSHKVASKEDNNHVNNINKTTYGKSDKHTRQKSKIPRRVVDTGGGGSGSGRSRRVEQQQPPPPKTTKDKAETKAAETKAERIPLSPSPARVVSDIPAVQSAEMTPIDLTDEN
ncbi:hypothetical protein N0V85_004405 [Neurospora sp. IMI 360204]|nr:hypothetical protein N0V85_004405 [Neurospora sp. IMI 360204]